MIYINRIVDTYWTRTFQQIKIISKYQTLIGQKRTVMRSFEFGLTDNFDKEWTPFELVTLSSLEEFPFFEGFQLVEFHKQHCQSSILV